MGSRFLFWLCLLWDRDLTEGERFENSLGSGFTSFGFRLIAGAKATSGYPQSAF